MNKIKIAVNTQHTGNRSRDHRGFAEPMTSEQLDGLLSQDWLREMVKNIRNGQEKLKDSLPFVCPHYSQFRNNHRAQADIIPESFTYMTCIDVDDKSMVDEAIQRVVKLNSEEGGEWQDQVLRIDYSARRKVHFWLRMPIGKTIEETQQMFCADAEIPYDESCITPERFIFVTGIDEEIYRSPHWLEALSADEMEERRDAFLMRGLDVDGRPLPQTLSRGKSVETQPSPLCTEADARTRYIFKECMRECELRPEVLVVEGARHEAVKSILSVGATQLLTKEEFLGVLSEMMPKNWKDANILTLVDDFYTKYHDASQKMTQFQRRVFARSQKHLHSETVSHEQKEAETEPQTELSKLFASKEPPALPAVLPKLVKLVTQNTPAIFKAAVAQAMFPPLAAYPKKLSFLYIDNAIRELRLNCLIVAGTGSGKDSCTRQPLTHILADMKERDEINRKRLKKFNEEYNSKANNKQKPQRPTDLVIQIIKSDITQAGLMQRMEDAGGAPLYVRMNELEQWNKIEAASGRNNQFTIMKLCDDETNDFGSDRAGAQSVVASGSLHLNWNANTTPPKLYKYFRYVLTDGPVSRLCLATIPETEIGADIPVYGKYDSEYDAALKPYIDNLKAATGLVECPQACKLLRKLKSECADFARLSQDRVYDDLTHRALVIVFRKACLLYAANGMKWEKAIENFCRWSLFYDLYLKMTLFGDLIRHADDDIPSSKPGPRNLLELLPDEFSLNDAERVRQQQGINKGNASKMVNNWKSRGYVTQISDISYKKTIAYLQNIK